MKNKNLNNTYIRPIKIRFINFSGLKTLYIKETLRFLKIPAQTIIGPIFSSLMFMFVFSIVIGNRFESEDANLYINFLAPGLIIMSSLQNSFSNSSSSMISMKIQGNIIDLLMTPIGPFEIFFSMILAAVTRGIITGICCYTVFLILGVTTLPFSFLYSILFVFLGCSMMSILGLIAGIIAKKYDSLATFNNFIIQPLTFLSGTFYSIKLLPSPFNSIASLNPVFMSIDGFRFGVINNSDGIIFNSIFILILLNLVLSIICYQMILKGYKIKF